MLDEGQEVFVFWRLLGNFGQKFFQRSVDLRVTRDLRQQGSLSRKQHRLGDDVDDLPRERLERLRLTATREQAGQPVGNLHAEHEIVQRVVRAGDVRERKREEQKVFFASGPDCCVIGAMEDIQIAFGVDEDDGLIPALYRLHNVELQIVGLACAGRSGDEHVPFKITEG